jgi:hypothetical protein
MKSKRKPPVPPARAAELRAEMGLLTQEEVAGLLNIGVNALVQARSRGRIALSVVRVGKTPMFRRVDVEVLLARSTVPARQKHQRPA